MEGTSQLLEWVRSLGHHFHLLERLLVGLGRASPQFVHSQRRDLERALLQLREAVFGKSLPTDLHDPPLLMALAENDRRQDEIDRLRQRNHALRVQLRGFLNDRCMDQIEEEAAALPSPREQLALTREE